MFFKKRSTIKFQFLQKKIQLKTPGLNKIGFVAVKDAIQIYNP